MRRGNMQYVHGDYNVICDRCGFKKKRAECRLEWDNLLVCASPCYEPRQPQDLIRAIPDRQVVPLPRPEAPNQFINTPVVPEDL